MIIGGSFHGPEQPRLYLPTDGAPVVTGYTNALASRHSHSMVAGGLPEMSYTTRDIPGTSLQMRRATLSRNS